MTIIQLHVEQREAIAVAETHRRTSRARDVTLHHPHQAAPWQRRWRWRPNQVTRLPKRSAGSQALRCVCPPKRDCQVSNSLLPRPKVLWTVDP
jgi:hypothetical protein